MEITFFISIILLLICPCLRCLVDMFSERISSKITEMIVPLLYCVSSLL